MKLIAIDSKYGNIQTFSIRAFRKLLVKAK